MTAAWRGAVRDRPREDNTRPSWLVAKMPAWVRRFYHHLFASYGANALTRVSGGHAAVRRKVGHRGTLLSQPDLFNGRLCAPSLAWQQ